MELAWDYMGLGGSRAGR